MRRSVVLPFLAAAAAAVEGGAPLGGVWDVLQDFGEEEPQFVLADTDDFITTSSPTEPACSVRATTVAGTAVSTVGAAPLVETASVSECCSLCLDTAECVSFDVVQEDPASLTWACALFDGAGREPELANGGAPAQQRSLLPAADPDAAVGERVCIRGSVPAHRPMPPSPSPSTAAPLFVDADHEEDDLDTLSPSLRPNSDKDGTPPGGMCPAPIQGMTYDNGGFADTNGPRTAANASECCSICSNTAHCNVWSFNVDPNGVPYSPTACRWAHLNYCCFLHSSNANLTNATVSPFQHNATGHWTSGAAPLCRGPCCFADQSECGVAAPPPSSSPSAPWSNGTTGACAAVCEWNATALYCQSKKTATYPMPANASLEIISGPNSPLLMLPPNKTLTVSFYGDSITYLNIYEKKLQESINHSPYTANVSLKFINQGINGGTTRDLAERGFSPWGHLDPTSRQTGITFNQTLARDKPDVVAVQIGINDFMKVDPYASNSSAYATVLNTEVIGQIQAILPDAKIYMCSISVDGEETNNKNHADLAAYRDAMQMVGHEMNIPVIDLLSRNIAYEDANNCLNKHGGLLTGSGVHPYTPQGAMMLADAHAEGLMAALNL